MAENLSNLPNRSPGIGSTENSKQDKPEKDVAGDSVVKILPAIDPVRETVNNYNLTS